MTTTTEAPALPRAMAAAAAEIDQALDILLPPEEGPEAPLFAAMRYAVIGGGKRLRGFLVLEGARQFNVSRQAALRVAELRRPAAQLVRRLRRAVAHRLALVVLERRGARAAAEQRRAVELGLRGAQVLLERRGRIEHAPAGQAVPGQGHGLTVHREDESLARLLRHDDEVALQRRAAGPSPGRRLPVSGLPRFRLAAPVPCVGGVPQGPQARPRESNARGGMLAQHERSRVLYQQQEHGDTPATKPIHWIWTWNLELV